MFALFSLNLIRPPVSVKMVCDKPVPLYSVLKYHLPVSNFQSELNAYDFPVIIREPLS